MKQKLLYHHGRDLESVIYGEVKPNTRYVEDKWFLGAYKWLEKEVGFFPLFLAVGEDHYKTIAMTGYQDNWRRLLSYTLTDRGRRIGVDYRKKGEFPNKVLFSFDELDGIFMDFDYWHIVLNASPDYKIKKKHKRWIFKPFWSKEKWLEKSRRKEWVKWDVQMVVPSLYLPGAKRIWVRNKKTKKYLEETGFENVEVRRLKVEPLI